MRAIRSGSIAPPFFARIHRSNAGNEGASSYRTANVSRRSTCSPRMTTSCSTHSAGSSGVCSAPARRASVRDHSRRRCRTPSDPSLPASASGWKTSVTMSPFAGRARPLSALLGPRSRSPIGPKNAHVPDVTEIAPADSPKQTGPRTYDSLISDCVHCGFCLPACPTYVSWGEEMDSPRGRIDLMKGVSDGVIPLDDLVTGHIDACLGCMGCVTACPSGVRYDLLIEATRAKIEEQVPRSPSDRAFRAFVFALFPYPQRLRVLAPGLWLAAKLGLTRLAASPLGKLLPPR